MARRRSRKAKVGFWYVLIPAAITAVILIQEVIKAN